MEQTSKVLVYEGEVSASNATDFPPFGTTGPQMNPDLRGRSKLAARMLMSHVLLDLITMGLVPYNTSQDGRFDVSAKFIGTMNSALNNYTSDRPVLPLGQLYGPPASDVSLDFVQLDPNVSNLSLFGVRAFLVAVLCLPNTTRCRFALLALNRPSHMPVRSWVPLMNELERGSNFTSNGMPSVQTRRFSGYQRTLCWMWRCDHTSSFHPGSSCERGYTKHLGPGSLTSECAHEYFPFPSSDLSVALSLAAST